MQKLVACSYDIIEFIVSHRILPNKVNMQNNSIKIEPNVCKTNSESRLYYYHSNENCEKLQKRQITISKIDKLASEG